MMAVGVGVGVGGYLLSSSSSSSLIPLFAEPPSPPSLPLPSPLPLPQPQLGGLYEVKGEMTLWETFKCLFGIWYLVPLRVSLLVPCCFAMYVLAKFKEVLDAVEDIIADKITLGEKKKKYEWSQMEKWLIMVPFSVLVRAMLFISGFYWIEKKGVPASGGECAILVANHSSFLDPILLSTNSHPPCFVSKAEVQKWPLVSTVGNMLSCIYVEREDTDSRVQAYIKISERLENRSDRSPQILIFPEGTSSNGGGLINFKQGAFRPQVAVQPVCIKYKNSNFQPVFPCGCNVPLQIFRILCQFVNRVEITYLPVMTITEEEKKGEKQFSERVRAAMANSLNVPTFDINNEDVIAIKKKKKKTQ